MMASGTGKTRVAVDVSVRLARPGEIVVLTCPALSLLGQTLRRVSGLQLPGAPAQGGGLSPGGLLPLEVAQAAVAMAMAQFDLRRVLVFTNRVATAAAFAASLTSSAWSGTSTTTTCGGASGCRWPAATGISSGNWICPSTTARLTTALRCVDQRSAIQEGPVDRRSARCAGRSRHDLVGLGPPGSHHDPVRSCTQGPARHAQHPPPRSTPMGTTTAPGFPAADLSAARAGSRTGSSAS